MSLAATFPARGGAIIFQLTRLSAPKQPNFCRSQRGKNEVARAQEGPDGSQEARLGSCAHRERKLQAGEFLLKAIYLGGNVTTFEALSTSRVSGVTKPHVTPPTALP